MSLRSHLLSATDPVRLARQLGMKPDGWQQKVLRSSAARVHLNIHRQGGKTTTTAVAVTHQAIFRPGSLSLVVSPTQRQSSELFRKVLNFYRQLGRPVSPEAENALSLVLENGSRVISVPGSEQGIRGYSADLVVLDEAARVTDDLYASISPMVAVTGGRIILLSTPAGRRGFFYEAAGSNQWEHFTVTATECPRISPAFLEQERESLGDLAFRQEYLCEFVDAAGAAFAGDDIDALFAGPAPERIEAPVLALSSDADARRHVAENQRMIATRAERIERRRVSEQARCEHRWRIASGGAYCVFCMAAKEEVPA